MTNTVEIKTHTQLQRLIKKGADVYVAIQGMPHVTIKAVKSDVLEKSKKRQQEGGDVLRGYDGQEEILHHYVDYGKHGEIYLDGGF